MFFKHITPLLTSHTYSYLPILCLYFIFPLFLPSTDTHLPNLVIPCPPAINRFLFSLPLSLFLLSSSIPFDQNHSANIHTHSLLFINSSLPVRFQILFTPRRILNEQHMELISTYKSFLITKHELWEFIFHEQEAFYHFYTVLSSYGGTATIKPTYMFIFIVLSFLF